MPRPLLLTGCRLVDGLGDTARDDQSILVEGDRIRAVESGRPDVPDADVVDLAGRTVLPGLIDTHVHTTLMDRACLPLFLAAGVTSVRDVGGQIDKTMAIRAELTSGAPGRPPHVHLRAAARRRGAVHAGGQPGLRDPRLPADARARARQGRRPARRGASTA